MQHRRKTPRAQWYDYTSLWTYFITICTKDRVHYFGDVVNGNMILNELGQICDQKIQDLSHRKTVNVHEWVVMPNHIHMVIDVVGADHQSALSKGDHQSAQWKNDGKSNELKNIQSIKGDLMNRPYDGPSLSSIVKLFKGNVTKYAQKHNIVFARQRSFHDHIIRNQQSYERIINYIRKNPESRKEDCR